MASEKKRKASEKKRKASEKKRKASEKKRMASEKKRQATGPAISRKASEKKREGKSKPRRVVFNKADYQKFARRLERFSATLSPEEQALLLVVLSKGSQTIRSAGDDVVQTVMAAVATQKFNLRQLIVRILLALQGIEAVVEEDGPSWVQEITATTKT